MFKHASISTEHEAYILGFLYADGFVTGKYKNGKYYSVGSSISSKDRQILNDIHAIFILHGYVSHISDRLSTCNGKQYPTVQWRIGNVNLVQNLISIGISPNKTYEDSSRVFDNVPTELKRHFVRGYFDGDGSICHGKYENKRRIKIISLNKSLIYAIDKWIIDNVELNIKSHSRVDFQDGKYPRITYSGNPNCKKIGELLYRDSSIFLNRKKDAFDQIPELFVKKSKYVGVVWNKQRNKWMARIYIDKTKPCVYGGLYSTEEDAYEASKKLSKSISSTVIGC